MTTPDPLAGLRDELTPGEIEELEAAIAWVEELASSPRKLNALIRKAEREQAEIDAVRAVIERSRSAPRPHRGDP
jgi:hypothetical protein